MSVDDAGNVYVVGSAEVDDPFVTRFERLAISYSNSGQQRWLRRIPSPIDGGSASFAAADLAPDGALLHAAGPVNRGFSAIALRADDGSTAWERYRQPSGRRSDSAQFLTVNPTSGVVQVVSSSSSSESRDVRITTFSSTGRQLWTAVAPGMPGSVQDGTLDVVLDSSDGRLYASILRGPAASEGAGEAIIASFTRTGQVRQVQPRPGVDTDGESAHGITVDPQRGQVLLTGSARTADVRGAWTAALPRF